MVGQEGFRDRARPAPRHQQAPARARRSAVAGCAPSGGLLKVTPGPARGRSTAVAGCSWICGLVNVKRSPLRVEFARQSTLWRSGAVLPDPTTHRPSNRGEWTDPSLSSPNGDRRWRRISRCWTTCWPSTQSRASSWCLSAAGSRSSPVPVLDSPAGPGCASGWAEGVGASSSRVGQLAKSGADSRLGGISRGWHASVALSINDEVQARTRFRPALHGWAILGSNQ